MNTGPDKGKARIRGLILLTSVRVGQETATDSAAHGGTPARGEAQRRRWITAIATVVTLIIMAVTWHSRRSVTSDAHQTAAKSLVADEKWTVQALLALKPNQLEGMDIALMNLLCVEGLRGSEKLDIDMALDRLDEFATRVRVETDRNIHRFDSNPSEYQNSKPYFRMLMLVTVLQQDFGIRYNPARVTPVGVFEPNDKFFADSRDVFLHGLTGEPGMGTCSSLPVLYVAVGRRLTLPALARRRKVPPFLALGRS